MPRASTAPRPSSSAREAGLALPTAYHLLRTLVHEGYLCRDKGLFFLGEAAERLGSSGAQQKRRSTVSETLAQWRDSIGAPVYYAVYRDGEIEVVCVADTPGNPAVEEWADFRETGHAHAIGQCLLSSSTRRPAGIIDPVQSITPYTVRDNVSLLRRLERTGRMEPVIERQEYALGTVCAALPSRSAQLPPQWPFLSLFTRPIDCCPRRGNCKARSADYWDTRDLYQYLKTHSL